MDNQGVGKKSYKGVAILFGFILLIVATAIAAVLLGFVYAGIKAPSDVAVVRHVVCSEDVISEYNRVSAQSAVSQEDIQRIAAERTQAMDKIVQLKDMQNDPTCLYIATQAALQSNNISRAKEYLAAMKKLSDKGLFANTSLYGMTSVQNLENQIEIQEKFGPADINGGAGEGDTTSKDD